MKKVVLFGDSNTYGRIPGTEERRFPYPVRWTTLLQEALGDIIHKAKYPMPVLLPDIPVRGDTVLDLEIGALDYRLQEYRQQPSGGRCKRIAGTGTDYPPLFPGCELQHLQRMVEPQKLSKVTEIKPEIIQRFMDVLVRLLLRHGRKRGKSCKKRLHSYLLIIGVYKKNRDSAQSWDIIGGRRRRQCSE